MTMETALDQIHSYRELPAVNTAIAVHISKSPVINNRAETQTIQFAVHIGESPVINNRADTQTIQFGVDTVVSSNDVQVLRVTVSSVSIVLYHGQWMAA